MGQIMRLTINTVKLVRLLWLQQPIYQILRRVTFCQ